MRVLVPQKVSALLLQRYICMPNMNQSLAGRGQGIVSGPGRDTGCKTEKRQVKRSGQCAIELLLAAHLVGPRSNYSWPGEGLQWNSDGVPRNARQGTLLRRGGHGVVTGFLVPDVEHHYCNA